MVVNGTLQKEIYAIGHFPVAAAIAHESVVLFSGCRTPRIVNLQTQQTKQTNQRPEFVSTSCEPCEFANKAILNRETEVIDHFESFPLICFPRFR
jgi:hypothetical protein